MAKTAFVAKIFSVLLVSFESLSLASPIDPCDSSNFEGRGPTYFSIKKEFQNTRDTNILNVLKSLPSDYRKGFLLGYNSESVQSASFTDPRVILFGNPDVDDMILAYSGVDTPQNSGDGRIEILEFNPKHSVFCPRTISFDSKKPVFDDHPTGCAGCHGKDPRPNWNGYFIWQDFFGSIHGRSAKGSLEKANFEKITFPSINKNPIYSEVLPSLNWTAEKYRDWGDFRNVNFEGTNTVKFAPSVFSQMVSIKNQKRIGRMIQESPLLNQYKYAITAVFAGCDGIEGYLPTSLAVNHPQRISEVLQDTDTRMKKAYEDRREVVTRYNSDPEADSINPNLDYKYSLKRIAGLRFLLENRKSGAVNLDDWSTATDRDAYTFADGTGHFPLQIYKYWFNDVFKDESRILDLIKENDRYQVFEGMYGLTWERTCEKLKEFSLAQ